MNHAVHVLFLRCSTVGQPGSLERIMDIVRQTAFEVYRIKVGYDVEVVYAHWKEYGEEMLNELSIAYEKRHLRFWAQDHQSHLSLVFDIEWESSKSGEPKSAFVRGTAHHTVIFSRKDLQPEHHAQRLLFLAKHIYSVVKPVFGWVERCWYTGRTKPEHLAKLEIPHIYWANFFGPEYVEKYGKEYFLNAPGWRHEELDDGGILYVLAPVMARRVKGYKALIEEVKAYFGLESVRCEKRRK